MGASRHGRKSSAAPGRRRCLRRAKVEAFENNRHRSSNNSSGAISRMNRTSSSWNSTASSRRASTSSSTYTEARPAPAPQPVCQDCGTVSSITPISIKGTGSGLGAVAGAIAGVAAGNQVSSGSGTDVAKVVGAIAGGFAGNEAEKRIRAETVYDVTVRLDNGSTRTVRVADASSVNSGTRVRVVGSNLELL